MPATAARNRPARARFARISPKPASGPPPVVDRGARAGPTSPTGTGTITAWCGRALLQRRHRGRSPATWPGSRWNRFPRPYRNRSQPPLPGAPAETWAELDLIRRAAGAKPMVRPTQSPDRRLVSRMVWLLFENAGRPDSRSTPGSRNDHRVLVHGRRGHGGGGPGSSGARSGCPPIASPGD
jgi:hypothetical protein